MKPAARRSAPLALRPATLADAELLATLGARTFADTFAADNTAADMQAYLAAHYGPALQAGELRDPACRYLVAEAGGVPAGFALLRQGPAESCVHAHHPLQLARLYVDRPFLRSGVGAALLARCLQDARTAGHDVLWLGVWERNTRARAFYARWGFEPVGTVTFTLGSDAQRDLVLARPLTEPQQ